MSLTQVINAAYAVLGEGLDEEGERRLDESLNGATRPRETQQEAFLRARQARPARGAPAASWTRQPEQETTGPPPMPKGYKLAPPGVQVREPEPTRGLDVVAAAFGRAPRPTRAKPAREQ